MFLLDTDVLSALRKRERAPAFNLWIASVRATDLYLSVVSLGEVERGVAAKRRKDTAFADRLAQWLDQTIIAFGERILPFDLAAARRWGRLSAAIGNNNPDLQIAATALEHGLTVVTRNVAHFTPTGVATLDPFAA